MEMFTHKLPKYCLLTLLVLTVSIQYSCVSERVDPVNGLDGLDGLDGFNALIDIISEPSGENCSSGGIKITIGQDVNENGVLDESEIESINFICNGSSGTDGQSSADLLAQTSPEQPGDNCQFGGTLIEIGNDTNNNESLDSEEVVSSFFICNGSDGTNGSNGNDGSDGSDGIDGNNGADGFSSIIRATSESSGDNCSSGGLKIEIGLDSNDNLNLDSEEIQSTYYICNGANGIDGADGNDGSNGLHTLSNVITEPMGDTCPNGGYKLEVGLDSNNNGALDASEVSSENYICNGDAGTNGNDGFSSLIRMSIELPGGNCSDGGIKIEVGLDDITQNGILEADEVDFTQYVCDGLNGGENGLNTIIQTITEEPGDNCANGGVRIQVGLDANTNNELDAGEEIGGAFYVCNGLDGTDGSNGIDGENVIVISTPAISCENGGSTLEFGHDGNNDGDLADEEDTILSTVTICNGVDGNDGSDGADGYNTIIVTTPEEPSDNCPSGGLAFNVGLDINSNNTIDIGEEVGTYYTCNGADGNDGSNGSDGRDVIVSSSSAKSCSNGGVTLEFGYDGNSDGDLEDGEDTVLSSTTICNGADGLNGFNTIISTNTEEPGDNCPNGGVEFTVGLDSNGNNIIDIGEEVGTYYVCNGADGSNGSNGSNGTNGKNSLISVTAFSGNQNGCSDGGIRIQTGIDDSGDGILQIGEVDATAYVCNGSDGNDGSDGNSDGVFEFYFQEGFDGYNGVIDLSISDKEGNENGQTFSVDRLGTDSHGLLYFPDVDRMAETIGTTQFEIVEAILYLKGKSTQVVEENTDNFIGVKIFSPTTPLFKEEGVTWTSPDGTSNWTVPGGTSNDDDGDANPYSDMFRLPQNITFNGYIPLLLNKSEIEEWRTKGNNKGLVLLMVDDATGYELDIISSDNTKNVSERPTLYIKAKVTSQSRSRANSNQELKPLWNQKTYKEKLSALWRMR